jgi:UDP-D-galactose:(glucosyl)LPS alpha-1,3-D-galactosyltransferase
VPGEARATPVSLPTVVFGVDARYVRPLLVTLTSLATAGGVDGDVARVAVLHHDLPADAVDTLARVGDALGLDLATVAVEPDPRRFPITDWISPAAYLRLQLDAGTRGADRVLYLDCDLVVLAPVAPLLATPLTTPLGAVVDLSNPVLEGGSGLPGFAGLGLPGSREYFNRGVLLVDVDRWVDERVGEASARFLADHPEHIRYWDQCALNFVLDDAWDRLDPEWNSLPLSTYLPALREQYAFEHVVPLDEALAIESRARVLHFAGPFKPWLPNYPDREPGRTYRRFVDALDALDGADPAPAPVRTPDGAEP